MARAQIHIPSESLAEFCRRWKVAELALFGSALRSDLKPDSDVDISVAFEARAAWSLMDHVRIQDELAELLGRKVDLVSRKGIERSHNYIRRKAILDAAEVIYAAA